MIGERDALREDNARLRQEVEDLRRHLAAAEETIRDTRPLIEGPDDDRLVETLPVMPRREEQPVDAEALARSVLEQAADAVVICDAFGRVVRASRSARDLCLPGPLQRPFTEAFAFQPSTEGGLGPADCLARALHGQEVRGVELGLAASDGRHLDMLLSARPLMGPDGRPAGAVLTLTDFTERKKGEDRLAAQYLVSRLLAAAATAEEAMPRILEVVGRRLGWEAGAFWTVDRAAGVLRATVFWQATAGRFGAFETVTRDQVLTAGADLPGRVLSTGEPWWVADLPQHPEFPRAAVAAREGLRGAYAFPARLGDEILGIVEFFCGEVRRPDDDMLRAIAALGQQIGQFLRRVHAQAALEQAVRDKDEALALLDTLLDRAPIGFAFVDMQLRFHRVNRHLAELHGVPAAGHFGRTEGEIHPSLATAIHPLLEHVRDTGEATSDQEVAGPTRWQDNQPGHWLVSCYPVRRSVGEMLGVGVVVVDITERKRMEEALREGEARFRQLAESLPQLIWTCDADGACDYLSRQWQGYTGRLEGDLLGDGWLSVVHPDDVGKLAEKWHACVANGTLFDAELRIRDANGRFRWFKGRAIPVRDAAGRVIKWFGSHTDIDDQKRAEQTLREADRRKDEFLAMLSHELRNPLAPIRNALEVIRLRGGERREVLRQAWDMVERQVEQLSRLVDDLLDVSRITRGKIALRQEPVEVPAVVTRAVETSRPLIEARRHQLDVSLPEEPLWVRGDATRLAQVLLNLLNNAAKYTDEGGRVSLHVRREDDEVVFRVRDTGIGIPPEMLPRVFDLFTQVDPTLERTQGGLGIGLTLVRRLVQMHGGTATAQSEGRGRGSEFVVRLPLLPAPAAQAETTPPPPQRKDMPRQSHRVLVVDDNKDAAESLVMLLRLFGHDTALALDGPTALRMAAQKKPEIVLCDIGMPGMNGYEVARQLRQMPGGDRILLIAITGFGATEDRRRTAEAGFDAHLVKPVEPEDLLQLLRQGVPS